MKRLIAVSLVALAASVPTTHAVPILPGSFLLPVPQEPEPAGGFVVHDLLVQKFSVPGKFSGTLSSFVIAMDPTNPFGGITFAYALSNDGLAGPNSIGRVSLTDFGGYATDVSYRPSAGTVAPAFVDRDATSSVVGFSFLPLTSSDPNTAFLTPGSFTSLLVIQTNAFQYTRTVANVIDGAVATVPSLGPIPEPATLALVAPCLLVMRRRR